MEMSHKEEIYKLNKFYRKKCFLLGASSGISKKCNNKVFFVPNSKKDVDLLSKTPDDVVDWKMANSMEGMIFANPFNHWEATKVVIHIQTTNTMWAIENLIFPIKLKEVTDLKIWGNVDSSTKLEIPMLEEVNFKGKFQECLGFHNPKYPAAIVRNIGLLVWGDVVSEAMNFCEYINTLFGSNRGNN